MQRHTTKGMFLKPVNFFQSEEISGEFENAEDQLKTVLECTSAKPVMTSLDFNVEDAMNFFVEFTPSETKKIAAEMRLSVVDNPFEDATIQLLGEGFEEEVTIDNIHGGNEIVPLADIEDENYAGRYKRCF